MTLRPFRASDQGKRPPEVSHDTSATGDTPSEAIDAATETRERLHAGVAYLTGHLADRERFNRGRHRLTHILTDEYLPLIEQIREIVGTASLQEQLAETERRLSIGWTVKKPGADERFAELATLYAVLSDALSESAVTAPWLDRIGWLEEGAA